MSTLDSSNKLDIRSLIDRFFVLTRNFLNNLYGLQSHSEKLFTHEYKRHAFHASLTIFNSIFSSNRRPSIKI